MTSEDELTCDFTEFLSRRLGASAEKTRRVLGTWLREQHRLRSEAERCGAPVIGTVHLGETPSILRKAG